MTKKGIREANEKLDFEVADLKLKLKHAAANNTRMEDELSVLRAGEDKVAAVYVTTYDQRKRAPVKRESAQSSGTHILLPSC